MTQNIRLLCRLILLLLIVNSLTGCVWWRLLQTKNQMQEFESNFSFIVEDDFSLAFKDPLLFSDDFIYLAKLQPTSKQQFANKQRWRYVFRKVDINNVPVNPEVSFYWDLSFNKQDRLEKWSLSPLFTKMAPPVFLQAFFRSIADANIDVARYRLNVDLDPEKKVSAELPQKETIIAALGKPIETYFREKKNTQTYVYRFILDSPEIQEGYEERAISKIKLVFDIDTDELVKFSGRYAGLKIAIKYRDIIR